MFVFVVAEFFSVEVFEAGVGLFEFTCREPEVYPVMDDAANVFPGSLEGDICAVYGEDGKEVFTDGLVYDCFDLFFGFCWGLCVYPVTDALFEGFSG